MCLFSTIIGTLFCLFIQRQPQEIPITDEMEIDKPRFCESYLKYDCFEKISKVFKEKWQRGDIENNEANQIETELYLK
jgi:hypothetical protein